MSNPIPFRNMRQTLIAVQAQVQLLLGVPELKWPQTDYALFLALAEMTKKAQSNNPTRKQLLAVLGAWLRFYKRLVDALPESHEVRGKIQTEFDKVSEPYQGLLEAKAK